MHEGNNNKSLFILNYSLIEHCKKKNYSCVDLARKLKANRNTGGMEFTQPQLALRQ